MHRGSACSRTMLVFFLIPSAYSLLIFVLRIAAPSRSLTLPIKDFFSTIESSIGSRRELQKMLTCIARPKQHGNESVNLQDEADSSNAPNTNQAIKILTSQIKEMALKSSGAYKCSPCSRPPVPDKVRKFPEPDKGSGSERFKWSYRRTLSSNSASRWGKEMEARLKGLSSGEGNPSSGSISALTSASGRRTVEPVVLLEESEPKEWVAQVEPGVLITFVSFPRGGNHLKRIRFSQDIFNKGKAQRWWTENYEKIMELYNVQRLNRQAFPLPTPPRSEDEISKLESMGGSPVTPPLNRESLPHNLNRGTGLGMGYSSSDSFDQHSKQSHQHNESSGLASTPKHSNISGTKTESSSIDESVLSTSSRDADRSGELSVGNASDLETEWVEEDEPGVYISIRALPGGHRELRRVRFSREKFGEPASVAILGQPMATARSKIIGGYLPT
ncbi:hypothetical protein Nepgr_019935 [Nepenthes gracilis]|uniref:BRX domain-containing protein n=1 Tax=Nepenthes gracilis TaxID=150966 RepID=A0AAD3SWQ9_NEPGR|nr:hypothetical protein Nepgr_019935 [Nepenthes gracilis]